MENSTNKNYNVIIYNVIRKLGLRPNHLGTVLISKAVPLIKEKADIIVIEDIYNELANINDSFSPAQVRVAIRYAIMNRNEEKTIMNFESIFGYEYDEELFTNKDFLEELARII